MKWLVAGLLAVVLIMGAWYLRERPDLAPTPTTTAGTSTTPAPATLAPELYPLYSGAQWQPPQAEEVTVGTTTLAGASVASAPLAAGMDPGSIITPFERYYAQKLNALGWLVANEFAAGGHVGGQTGYRKNTQVILTRFRIVYHTTPANAPSECPCDVVLSLFSATTTP